METFSRETSGMHPWFVTGLAEGVGVFTYSRGGGTVGLYFAVKAAAQDEELLARLRAFFGGAGKIYPVKPRKAGPSGGRAPAGVYYRVTRISDLQRLVDHFDAFPLRGSKRRAYGIWRKMVELKTRRFRRPDLARIERLALQLSAASPRARPQKS